MQIDSDVMLVLERLQIDGCEVRITGERLDRKLYTRVNKVLEALGGKWTRKVQAHVFPDNAAAHIETAITTGEVTTASDIGFFPTPIWLSQDLVVRADVKKGDLCLEPSAGTGRIVDSLLHEHAAVVAVERDPAMRAALEQRCLTEKHLVVHDGDDFLTCETIDSFDAVVMNPAFNKVGLGDCLDHVRHAYSMLQPRGRLVSVMPISIKFRESRRYADFRVWYTGLGGRVTDLPDSTFRESGTNVRACVLELRRPSI
jgi:phospholipid N-methyltransferase